MSSGKVGTHDHTLAGIWQANLTAFWQFVLSLSFIPELPLMTDDVFVVKQADLRDSKDMPPI